MKTTCINHPTQERILLIRQWQIEFCDGNHCAAALLNFFEYWHNIKLEMSEKNRQANRISEAHGDENIQDESLYQFHNNEELQAGILGIYGKTKIVEALNLLQEKGVISIHKNPNPRYHFDQTNHFIFYPEIINEYLFHRSEMNNGVFKNGNWLAKNEHSSFKNEQSPFRSEQAIPEITTKITSEITSTNNNNSCLNSRNGICQEDFERFWKKLPAKMKVGKKNAFRHFKASVKTQKDFENLEGALENYKQSERFRKGFIQNGSTWFNNWQDWAEYDNTNGANGKSTDQRVQEMADRLMRRFGETHA